MNAFLVLAVALNWIVVGVGCWLSWQLLRQNGRILLRLEDLEQRLDALVFGDESGPLDQPPKSVAPEFERSDLNETYEASNPKSEIDQSLLTSASTNGDRSEERRVGKE